MQINKISSILPIAFIVLCFYSLCFSQQLDASLTDDIDLFIKTLGQTAQDSTETIELGNRIFSDLSKKNSLSSGFINLKSRLQSASFLANKMQSQLHKSMHKRLLEITDDKKQKKTNSLVVAPAKYFYDSSINLFSTPANIESLVEKEKRFLTQYYNLILRRHIENISSAGLGYAVAESSFKGTYDYVLVLPLLHSPNGKGVSLDVLPLSMKTSKLLNQLADSALLHFGRVTAAMSLARNAATISNSSFNEIDYYVESADKCSPDKANIAVDCLNLAIKLASVSEPGRVVELNIEIIDTWQKSKNYSLAAGHAKDTYGKFPDDPKTADIIWLYYYSLSCARQGDAILVDIDNHIEERICLKYRENLMYIKWWAMRLTSNDSAELEALEYQMLKEYSDSSIITPIMLSRATDMIARQDYSQAYILLNQLIENFPGTKSTVQAKKIVEKLKAREGIN